jgi:site-specific DNA recombinase
MSAIKTDDRAKRAVIYLRVSTAMQADTDYSDEGFSIPAQREACLREAERLGAVVVDEYVDRGESARSADRPQLKAMLERLKYERDIDLVIVHKVDRLARNRQDDVEIVVAIKAARAKLVSATEQIDDTPGGKLMHGIMATIAEYYSANLATEVVKGLRQKAKLGGTPGKAPVGYINVIERSDGKTLRTVVIDKERAEHVRWAFEAYATGDYLLRELVEELDNRGLRSLTRGSKGDKPLSKSVVEKMLKNPYYIGFVTYEGVRYQGRHEPLISLELWEQVQAVKAGRAHSKEKPSQHPHYLKGTLFCGCCGARLGVTKIRNRHGVIYSYFYCLGRQRDLQSCRQGHVPMEKIERAIEDQWMLIQLPEPQIAAIRRAVLEHIGGAREAQVNDVLAKERRLSKLESEREKLMEAYYANAIPVDVLRREQQRIGDAMIATRVALDRAAEDLSGIEGGLEQLISLVADCGRLYLTAPMTIRRQLNQAVFEKIFVDHDVVGSVYLRQPFEGLIGPTFELAVDSELRSRRYRRANSPVVTEQEIEDAIRQILGNESEAADGCLADPVSSPDSLKRTPGSNMSLLVPPGGLEPPTHGLGNRCSIP